MLPIPSSNFQLVSKLRKCAAWAMVLVFAQLVTPAFAESPDPPRGPTQVAYVYVSHAPSGGTSNVIAGYAAAADGRLSPVPGSPFAGNVTNLAANRRFLFGSDLGGVNVLTFRIRDNGALKFLRATDAGSLEPDGCDNATPLVVDRTGANLYREQFVGGLCEDTEFQSFSIDRVTGDLSYIGKSATQFLWSTPLSFGGNNMLAYGTDCIDYEIDYLDTFSGLARQGGGLLDYRTLSLPTPAAQNTGDFYCRSQLSTDEKNHVAVAMVPINFDLATITGPEQLGTYTADASGNLTTSSTWSNMPPTDVGYVLDLRVSPAGNLVAVAGGSGLQVFYFNGSSQIKPYTGLLTTDQIDQISWDNENHLYGISQSTGKLYVFTVTINSAAQAPGSPYTITSSGRNFGELVVHPRMKGTREHNSDDHDSDDE